MAPLKEIESDDQEISLKLRVLKKNYDEIPLDILAKSIKESHNNERQEKTTCNITNYIKQTAENESNLKNDSQNDQQQKKKKHVS